MVKKTICLMLSFCFCVLFAAGCNRNKPGQPSQGEENIDLEALPLEDIVYEKTALNQMEGNGLRVKAPSKGKTGEDLEITVQVNRTFEGVVYHIIDWGDGTWSHEGPYRNGAVATLFHRYREAGNYDIRAYATNIEYSEAFGWSAAATVAIEGDRVSSQYITKVKPIFSSEAGDDYKGNHLCDNDNGTSWRSREVSDQEKSVWGGYEFDTYYRLTSIEMKIPLQSESWPSDFAIEYTTDRGANWNSLPKYYYVYPAYTDSFFPKMHYLNPQGATLVLDLDGVVANGIRVISKGFEDTAQKRYLEIAELRVTGDREFFFSTSIGGHFDAELNNMWTVYGSADTEPNANGNPYGGNNGGYYRTGNALTSVTEWLEWDGLKHNWRVGTEAIMELYKPSLYQVYIGPDGYSDVKEGYAWATTVPYTPQHLGRQNHYTYNSTFIIAARNYLLQKNNMDDFFTRRNNKRQEMLYRLETAMDYMLTEMDGESGVLTIQDPRNDATVNGVSSNYWDQLSAFGYQSSYENVLFYRSLLALADIEFYLQNGEQGSRYLALAEKVKTEFNKLFWDEEKGRYITSVNREGTRLDFGITFSNFMACDAGLASEEQAQKIYDWVDGKRIVEGDTSTGADIYALVSAARANTVDVASIYVLDESGNKQYYWWNHDGNFPCTPGSIGEFRKCGQNGGSILYISYYDLMGRLRYLGSDNAFERFQTILDDFASNQQLRNIKPEFGVVGEFPESGLVPLTFVTGFMGITQDVEGLKIAPSLPSNMNTASVREYQFNNQVYFIQVSKDRSEASLTQEGDRYRLELPAEGIWILTADNQVVKK